MRIVAIADTHGKHRKIGDLPTGDVLVHAGDFTNFGSGRDDFLDWFENQPFRHRVLILGNHEGGSLSGVSKHRLESELEQRNPITYVGAQCKQVVGLWFGANAGRDLDVLVTHQPPKGVLDSTSDGKTVGSESVRQLCRDVEPSIHIFGHVHAGYGRREQGETMFVNCALAGDDYEPVNAPVTIDFENDEGG
jgi:Icc-related predicted phosphoesterase